MEPTQSLPLIFKTNIGKVCPNCAVYKALESHNAIQQWNIDHEDSDCILRVVSDTLTPSMVIALINQLGHDCLELQN